MVDPLDIGKTLQDTVKAALGVVSDELKSNGVIRNQGLLDLSSAKTADDFSHIRALHNVGLVLVPEALMAAFTKIPAENVGAVIPVPGSGPVRTYTGQVKMSGDALEAAGREDDTVVIAGQVIFTSTVTAISARDVVVAGQVIAPQSSQKTLAGAVTHLAGQIVYYPDNVTPRVMLGDDTLEEAFFTFLPERIALILVGHFRFADDVSMDTLRESLGGLVLIGEIECSASLRPALQALASEVIGSIRVAETDAG